MLFEVNPLVSVDKKLISPQNEGYIGNVLVCAHFSLKLAHGTALLRSYLDFKGYFRFSPMVMANPCSCDLNRHSPCFGLTQAH